MLFLDEIHRMARPAEEMLYMAMEDFRVDVIVGKGPGATAIPLEIAPFTLVGATTRAGLLPGPLRDRFGFTAHLDFYDAEDLEQVLTRSARLLGVRLTADGAVEIAGRSRGTPASPTGCCAGCATSPRSAPTAWSAEDVAAAALLVYEVDELGLDRLDRAVLRALVGTSAAARWASRRSRSPWGRSARPSRRWPSRSWSAPVCWPAHRAAGWPRRRPGRTWA